jgi:tripartite-type tricarboxylate transporter receptor subunit TctC
MITRRRFIASSASAAALGLTVAPRPSLAQAITGHARVTVGFPPGGSVDVVARLLVDAMKGYASSMIVENRPSAGGRTVLEELKMAPPNGSAMVLTPAGMITLFPHVFKQLAYEPLTSLTPVTPVATFSFVLAVGPMVPAAVRTLPDLLAWSKANPRQASYGTPGTGTLPHFLGETLTRVTRTPLTHVPYKGTSATIQDVMAGHLAMLIGTVPGTLAMIEAGKLRAILTTSPERSALLPAVPTVSEAGLPELEATEWFGLFLPGGAPASVVADLGKAVSQALKDPRVRDGFSKQSIEVLEASPSAFVQMIRDEHQRWGAMVKASGFSPID